MENVEAQILTLFIKSFFQLLGIQIELLIGVHLGSQRQLLCDLLSFSFVSRSWEDVSLEEVIGQLSRDFAKGLLGQFVLVVFEFSERNKLDVIPALVFLKLL